LREDFWEASPAIFNYGLISLTHVANLHGRDSIMGSRVTNVERRFRRIRLWQAFMGRRLD